MRVRRRRRYARNVRFPAISPVAKVHTIARGRLANQDELFVLQGCECQTGLALFESTARFMGLARTQERIERCTRSNRQLQEGNRKMRMANRRSTPACGRQRLSACW